MSETELVDAQKKKMQDQDTALDSLGNTVTSIKHIALAIGDEADEQNELLQEIDGMTDKTNVRVRNTGRRVTRIDKQSSARVAWAIIIILLISLVVLLILTKYT